MKKAIAIPIYLKPDRPEGLVTSEALRLAKRAIESLKVLEDQDFTLILPVCIDIAGEVSEGGLSEMDQYVRKELKAIRQERTLIFSSHHLRSLRDYLFQKNLKSFSLLIDLKGFPKIRNMGLLLAQAVSAEVAIFIDSDEVVEDPDYLRIGCEHLVRRWSGKEVVGKGGFYLNPDGSILLPPQRLWWRFLWDKTKWMNRVWENILSSNDRLVASPMLLGGNLVLHQYLFRSIPFDPYIPRGEDTDYLINASQLGFSLFFDKELRIKHLHPVRTEYYFQEELRGDIERFLYEREKVKDGLTISLDPYPGYFLRWTLYPKALLTSLFLSMDYLIRGEWEKAGKCLANLGLLFKRRSGGWQRYLKFRADWERVMDDIHREGLGGILESCWV
jgi:glycosyltransferase involved in cell wall biosynthesis